MKPNLIEYNKDQLEYLHKLHLAIDIDFESNHANNSVVQKYKDEVLGILGTQIGLLEDIRRANGKFYQKRQQYTKSCRIIRMFENGITEEDIHNTMPEGP